MARTPVSVEAVPLSAAQEEVVREQARQGKAPAGDVAHREEALVVATCHTCSIHKRGLSQSEAVTFREQHRQHPHSLTPQEVPVEAVVSEPTRWITTHCRTIFRATAQDVPSQAARMTGDTRDLALVAQEATGALTAFTRALAASKETISAISGPLQGQLVATQALRDQPVTAHSLPPISPELVADRLSDYEEQLQTCRKALTALRTTVAQADGRAAIFEAAAKVVVEAALVSLRTYRIQHAGARLAQIRQELAAPRGPHSEELAVLACCSLLDVRTGTPIVWPPDLLGVPE